MTTFIINPTQPIPVIALKCDGVYVGRYDSILDASFKLSVDKSSIIKCIKGELVSAGGFLFIKEEFYSPNKKITRASILRKRNFLKIKPCKP